MRIRFGSLIVVLMATVVAFLPVLQNWFVNWDDPFTLVGNPRLAPGVVRWSFTTTEMVNYQPLAWLARRPGLPTRSPPPSRPCRTR
jgi:hypothetical protein